MFIRDDILATRSIYTLVYRWYRYNHLIYMIQWNISRIKTHFFRNVFFCSCVKISHLFICFLFLHSLFTFNIFSIYDKWYTDVFHKRRYMDIIYKTSQADTKKDLFENFFLQKVVTFFCYFHFFSPESHVGNLS